MQFEIGSCHIGYDAKFTSMQEEENKDSSFWYVYAP